MRRRLRRSKHAARSLTAVVVVGSLALTGATIVTFAADTATAVAATSPSQQWITSVGAPATGVGTSTTFQFGSTGVTGKVDVTAGINPGGFWPENAGFELAAQPFAQYYLDPLPPAGTAAVNQGTSNAGRSIGTTITLSKPIIYPNLHLLNLDGSYVTIGGTAVDGSPINLNNIISRNSRLDISGNTINAVTSPPQNGGCDNGNYPNGACGSIEMDGATSHTIQSFTMVNVDPTYGGDSWVWTLSYPTAPLTKQFSPSTIPAGGTSTLTFTIANPANEAQPTLTPLDFTDKLPTGVSIADNTVTNNGSCGTPTVNDASGTALGAGDTGVKAGAITVAAGSTCTITVDVTSNSPGTYTNDNSNLSTTVANLIPSANTTLTVTSPAGSAWTCSNLAYLFKTASATSHTIVPVDLVTGTAGTAINTADEINGVGYNVLDNYIYGWDATKNQLVRIGSGGGLQLLGLPAGMTDQEFDVADVDADGHYWVLGDNGAGSTYHWYEVDLAPGSATFGQVLTKGTVPASSTGYKVEGDWASIGGVLYSVGFLNGQTASGVPHLLSFDPTTGVTTDRGALTGMNSVTAFGAVYTDAAGNLYAGGNTTGEIWRINPQTVTALKLATGPTAALNDGARCAQAPVPSPSSTFTKTGIDQRSGATADSTSGKHGSANAGDTIKWVLNYANTTGSDATVAITDPITGAQTYVPNSLQLPPGFTGSVTGGTVSASGSVRGGTTAAQSGSFSPATANITTPGGDGYTAEGFGNNIYAVFHHSNDSTTVFCATTSNAVCPGWPGFSTYVSPTAGDALGTGPVPSLTTANVNGSFIVGGKLYWPAGSTVAVNSLYPVGMMCLDLTALTSCGFTQLDTVTQAPPSGILSGIAGDGIRAADGHYYYVDYRGNLLCFDPATGACGSVKVTGAIAPIPTAGAFAEVGTYGRYVYVSFESPNNTTTNLTCFDTTTAAVCSGFPIVTGASTVDYASEVMPVVTSTGTFVGACAVRQGLCFDPSGAALANPYSATMYGFATNVGMGTGQLVGTRYYTIVGGNTAGCFDFSLPLVSGKVQPCSGFVGPGNVRGYTVRTLDNLPGCLVANGDGAQIVLFNAKTGGACATATQSVKLTPSDYYCDGQSGHATSWSSVSLTGLTGSEYAGATLTLFGADGNPLPQWTNVAFPAGSPTVDISSIPVSGNTATLTAQVSLAAISDTAKVSASQVKLSWQGDPVQICYETVLPDVPCATTQTVTNSATAITSWDAKTDGPTGNLSGTVAFDVAPAPTTCASIVLTKQVGGRLDPADQFRVALSTSAGSELASVTTSGSQSSASTAVTPVVRGATYTITDAMAAGSPNALSQYAPTISCTDKSGNPVTTGGSAPNWTLTAADPTDYACTITNTPKSFGPTWSCDSSGYLFQAPNGSAPPFQVWTVDLATGQQTQVATTTGGQINGVGYNALDGYMYGIRNNNNGTWSLLRIASDGTVTSLGRPAGMSTVINYASGDIDPQGHYWTLNNSANAWYEVDLAPGSPTYAQVIDSGSTTGVLADWSWINGALYGVGTNNHLYKFTPATGFVDLGAVAVSGGIGATYADGTYLYASVNSNGDIFRIDISTLATLKVSSGQPTSGNDGARCASAPIPTITVTKEVAARAAPGDQFTVGLKNSAGTSLTTATTIGSATTASTTNWPVSQGATYTVTDAMAAGSPNPLSSYSATIACVDKGGNPVATGGSAPNWTIAVTAPTDYTCTVTNTPVAPGPAWSCSSSGYLFQNPTAGEFDIVRVDLVTGASTNLGSTTNAVNGVDFNPLDNYVYGTAVISGKPFLVRIAADGTMTSLAAQGATGYNFGAFDPSGHLWQFNGSTTAWVEYDLVPGSATYGTAIGSGTAAFPAAITAAPGDWSWIGGDLYGVGYTSAGQAELLKFGSSTHAWTLVGAVSAPGTSGIGATFTDGTYLYSSDNSSGQIYRIDPVTRASMKLSNGPVSSANDGARCASAPIPTITVKKVVAGRAVATDQFTVGLKDSSATTLTSATTTGSATTATTTNWPVSQGATYTITDAMAPGSTSQLSAYTATISCTDRNGNAVATGGSAPNWTLTVANAVDYTCTVTNTPGPRSYTVTKSVNTSGPLHAGDTLTYTVVVQNTGPVPYTAAVPATFTDNLASVLDDAAYNNDASNGATVSGSLLSWSGSLAPQGQPGDSQVITYSVTVNSPDLGDSVLTNAVVGGTNCPAGSTDPACHTTVKVQSYRIVKTADSTDVVPGATVHYTITVTNTGAVDYTAADPASFTDDLTEVLDDAAYNGDAAATGTATQPTYAAPTLSWSGALPVSGKVTVTYSVTVHNPDTGDHSMANAVVTPPKGPCPSGSTNPDCNVVIPAKEFTVTKSASASTAVPGDTITYTITVHNTGNVAFTAADPATFTDDLTGVLDDATFNANSADPSLHFDGVHTLTWSGALALGGQVSVSYTVTIKNPDPGDAMLRNVVTTPPEGSCATGTSDPGCTNQVPVKEFSVTKAASATTARPGDKITYTITVRNTGQVAFTAADPAGMTDDLSGVLDDAAYGNDAAAVNSTVQPIYTAPVLSWSGSLAIGDTVTITYSVTVKTPDTGDHLLLNAATPTGPGVCTDGSLPPCAPITVRVADYTVTKSASKTSASAGDVVKYTVTVTNTGQVAFTADAPASFVDNLAGVLDDATYNGDASNGATFAAAAISWSGAVAVGDVAVVTYSVTVNDPDLGDHLLKNAVTGGQCVKDSTDPACKTVTPVGGYVVTKSVSATSAKPGDTVKYTVTVVNTGQVAFTAGAPATFSDDLSGVLDDATYNNDATNGATFTSPTISWSGALGINQIVIITYSVTVNTPDVGDQLLKNAVTGGQCTQPSTDPACGTVTPIAQYTTSKTVDTTQARPGQKVTYTITVKNTGQVAYTAVRPASWSDDLSGVLDDASFDNDATGGATFDGAHTVSWSGPLGVGATLIFQYSVTVNAPDAGDHRLTNGVTGGICAGCVTPPVPVAEYTVTKTASETVAHPGDKVTYTITVTNTGQVAYTAASPATVTDSLASVLDDATYNNDADNGATYTAPVLSWSGALGIGKMAVITYSVTVNKPDTGDGDLPNAALGGDCTAAADPGCAVDVKVQSYTIVKKADKAKVVPGEKITYTITVTNTGQVAYTAANPAAFADNLSAVLDDATYGNDADHGATYTAPTLSWSGPLAVGGQVVVTYSVTVNSPDTGDQKLDNAAVSTTTGGNCPPGSTDPQCSAHLPANKLTVRKTATPAVTTPGGTVHYTITVQNTGQTDYTAGDPATLTDDLSGVLDDAAYNNDASNGAKVNGATLTWSGPLAVGDTATITYSVTVDQPDTGDTLLKNTVQLPPDENSNCPPDSTDPACQTQTPVKQYTVTKVASPQGNVHPGDTITYTVTVQNTGSVAYTAADPATFTDNLAGVLDDATYNLDASKGAVVNGSLLSWAGGLAPQGTPGDSATVTYSVTVNKPDLGDSVLKNAVVGGTNCVPGSGDAACSTVRKVQSYRIVKTTTATQVKPGEQVPYTITITNTGAVPYTAADPASLTDNLTGVLDDAAYDNNATASDGSTVSYAAPNLTWSGVLGVGDKITITYSVTVDNPDNGDAILTNAVVTPINGPCPPGSTNPDCGTVVPERSYTVVKTASKKTTAPGDTVKYTITVHNTGAVAFTAADPAVFTDDLSGVLDDATYNNDANNGATYAAPTLSWEGALGLGATVEITYTVTVNDPDAGDSVLRNVVTSTEGSCVAGSTDPGCASQVPVKHYTIAKSASPKSTKPGDTVTYTLTVANTGQVAFTDADPAAVSDDLTDVLDDAVYNKDAKSVNSTVAPTYADPVLSWSGPLAIGDTVTITYSVTVSMPDNGDHKLKNAVDGTGPVTCTDGTAPPCAPSVVPVADFTVTKTARPTSVDPGGTVTYSVLVHNTGQVAFTAADPASFTDDLSGVLDDATYNKDATQGATVSGTTLSWSGAVDIGDSVRITYSVTVDDPDTGDHLLKNAVTGGQCAQPSNDPACGTVTPVAEYTTSKSVDTAQARPGQKVTYTITVKNTGQVAYTAAHPATWSDDLSGVLDDATFDDDATGGATFDGAHTVSWSGALGVGATLTFKYSVTVDLPDTGDHVLTNGVTGGICGGCVTPPVPVAEYTVTKTASETVAHPGDKVTYTITVHNTGQVAYTAADPATFTDNLAATLDDATYDGDATNGATYSAPVLSWSGALAIGATAVVKYSVTVDNPDTGDADLPNAVLGGDCVAGTDPGCSVDPKVQSYRAIKTVDKVKVTPGEKVTYTVTLINTGQVDYTANDPASYTDDLTNVLDDATYNNDADNGATYAAPVLSWSGPLPVGGRVTVRYSVTVRSPDKGDLKLGNTVVTTSPGGNCPEDSTNPDCTADVPGKQLQVTKTASVRTTHPGERVTYTIAVTNTGQTDFTAADPATLTDDLSGVLDDATYNGDATGGATVSGSTLSWSGALTVGATVVIKYSVTVDKPDNGDKLLKNVVQLPPEENSNCSPDSTEPTCRTVTPVAQYEVVKKASTQKAKPGDTVTYTITVTNTGEAAYPADDPARFTDDLRDVLDDAVYNNDATSAPDGTVTYAEPRLSWSSALAVGGVEKVTYTVRIDKPDHGDGLLVNVVTTPTDPNGTEAANCSPNSPDPSCKTETAVASAVQPPPAATGNDTELELLLAGLLLAAGALQLALGLRRRRPNS